MPAYLIVRLEGPVRDAEAMAEYQRRTRSMGVAIRPMPRVVYGAIHPLEGTPPEGMVVLEFASVEEARGWYESPGYQDALQYRQKAGDFTALIVESFELPAA